MKTIKSFVAVALALVLGLTVAHASGPISVYALIEKVTFEPGSAKSDKAQRIRIDGVFILANLGAGNATNYSEPQRGSLYFDLTNTNEPQARKEWADLESVAGTRQVVGFGSSWSRGAPLQVTRAGKEASASTPYPMGNGLVKINADQPRAKALLEFKGR
ncbi:MAG: hypothetical protein ABI824_08495 [Acidobacteriota bacterium]